MSQGRTFSDPIAVGRTAEVYAWQDGQVLKLFREWVSAEDAAYEFRLTGMVHATGVSSPAVIGEMVEVNRRHGFVLDSLEPLPDGDRLCHGDFHPANIILTGRGPVIIDWMDATRGHPLADVAGLPESLPARLMVRSFRGIIRREYLRRYFRDQPTERKLLQAWLPILAAARLSEVIPEERGTLLSIVRKGLK
ncbi:MAG TPA: aminoglycoside phosphotransferase family protein [Anaerolineales bacterium]|nr:aminoglycoside phosphotransferase family protein [Anaerolineales bacterium]